MSKENNENKDLNRYIMLNENVSESSIGKVVEKIIQIINFDQENNIDYNDAKPIKLIINSYGGTLHDANMLIGVIESSTTPIHTYCYGKAMSAGLYIFASGHKRFTSPLATFMYHDATVGFTDTVEGLKASIEQSTKLRDRYDNYIVSRTNLPKHIMDEKKKLKEDWYLSGEEAIGYGLADEIIEFRTK